MAWIRAGKLADFEGVPARTVSLLGRKIGIFRTADGSLRAMDVMCKHQNADLSGAQRRGDVVVCARHGWEYDLSTGACLTEKDGWADLRTYELVVEGDSVKVKIGGDS